MLLSRQKGGTVSKQRKPPGNKPVLLVHPKPPTKFPDAVIGVIGPFPHDDAAEKWAREHLRDDYGWSVAELCHPNAFYGDSE